MKKIRILTPARHDLVDGFRFYETQAEGIGRYFLDTLYSDIESLRVNAGVHPLCIGSYHRLLSKRFPYSVYYRIEGRCRTDLRCARQPQKPGMDKEKTDLSLTTQR